MRRREFLAAVSATVSASPLAAGTSPHPTRIGRHAITIQQVIDRIIATVPGGPLAETVDTFKSGDPSLPVTGIATTFLATCDVVKRAAALGANLIITHEPTYFNHFDQTDWVAEDAVYTYKRRVIAEHGIAIWRFHDYWHRVEPDGILTGMLKALDWEEYALTEKDRMDMPSIVGIPPRSLAELAAYFKVKLDITHPLQIVGDPSMTCTRIGLLLGAYGGRSQIEFVGRSDVDVIVVGEINEWETSVFIEDARCAGRDVALLILGHANSEEPGMKWLVEWLQPLVPGIPVTHVPSHDPFTLV